MPLQLRPNCEHCDKDLPPSTTEARICSYECTFCSNCADTTLSNVCPNCGGNLTERPIRPTKEWRKGLSLANQPASTTRVHLKHSAEEVEAHTKRVKDVAPRDR